MQPRMGPIPRSCLRGLDMPPSPHWNATPDRAPKAVARCVAEHDPARRRQEARAGAPLGPQHPSRVTVPICVHLRTALDARRPPGMRRDAPRECISEHADRRTSARQLRDDRMSPQLARAACPAFRTRTAQRHGAGSRTPDAWATGDTYRHRWLWQDSACAPGRE